MGLFGKEKRLVGLDVGSYAVKAIEVVLQGSTPVVTAFGCAQVQGESGQRDAILGALSSGNIRHKRVVTSVSGRSVIVRFVVLQNMPDAELQKAIQYEADKYIPFEADQVVIDYQRLGESQDGKEIRVLLAAVKRSLVDEHIQLIKEAGLESAAIDYDSFALGNAFELRARDNGLAVADREALALVDVGATKSNIMIMGEAPYFTREVPLAGNEITKAISTRLGVASEAAEQLKARPQENEAEIGEAVGPVLEDLANEISLCLDYCENQHDKEVRQVFLSGGGSMVPGIEDFLDRALNRKVERWNPGEGLQLDLSPQQSEAFRDFQCMLPVAVGLAARIVSG